MAEKLSRNITVDQSLARVFDIWANFENFPHFMRHIKSVVKTGPKASHWIMEGPLGKNIEWDAQVTEFDPNRRIAWRSTEGDIQTSGMVEFSQRSPMQTEIEVTLKYDVPAGELGEAIAKLLRDPERQLDDDLRNFKRYAESQLAA